MTREEAIHFATCLKNNWTINFADMEDFCDMAIEALQEPTVIRSKTLFPAKDFKEWTKRVREENPNVIVIPCDAEAVDVNKAHEEEHLTIINRINELQYAIAKTQTIVGKMVESTESEWIPCSERLPKEDEYVGNVCKYYLIQDEYGDMHVAHLSGRGWETIESVKALGCDVVAWMPLPKPWKGADDE